MSRPAIANLSTENLLHNLEVLRNKSGGKDIIAMIKANAYAHGLRSTALRLDGMVYSFGVASSDEALALRKIGIKSSITLMSGAFTPEDIALASEQNFELIFHEDSQIDWLDNVKITKPIKIWFKINTGMGRLGFDLDKANEIYKKLNNHPKLIHPIGIISHFACADDPINPLNQIQIDNFSAFVKDKKGPKSFCNSAAIFSFEDDLYDVVRPGLSLYGISPFLKKSANELGLKPVMNLLTKITAISNKKSGDNIGYGNHYTCPKDMKIGVIAIGYGDGYPRTARDGTPVLVNNIRCPLVGKISMDMATIDLSAYPDAKIGDNVILWGENLPIEEIAINTDSIPYDIICSVQQRVKFYWSAMN